MHVCIHQADQFRLLPRRVPAEFGPFIVGDDTYDINPRFLVSAGDLEVIRLWQRTRRTEFGGGLTLRELTTMPAKLLSAFDVLDAADAEWRTRCG